MRPALYSKPDTDPSQRTHREMFTPWMQSIAEFSCPSPASARFSAVARTVTDLFVSTSFIHFWLPLPQSEYILPADVEMWTQLQLGQSWVAKPVAAGKLYMSMIQGRGELEVPTEVSTCSWLCCCCTKSKQTRQGQGGGEAFEGWLWSLLLSICSAGNGQASCSCKVCT